MPIPRRDTVSCTEPGVYQISSRFTQGWTLFGRDPVIDRDCHYRRKWVFDKCKELCRAFPVTIFSLTVRSDGYDMVLFIDPSLPREWAQRQVVERWCKYFAVFKDESGKRRDPTLEEVSEILDDDELVETWRERLCQLGSFVQELNGRIARRINCENRRQGGKGGTVWARRYEATRLLDELAVLTALIDTAISAVERKPRGDVRLSQYSTAYHCLRRTHLGWNIAEKPTDEFEELSKALPSLAWDTLWTAIGLVIDFAVSPRGYELPHRSAVLRELLIDFVGDVDLWVREWIKRKDIPRRVLGSPAKMAAFASKTGKKWLRLSWLGNGIYNGTANPELRRQQRVRSHRESAASPPN